ncbi:hypothetical protein [Microbaculum marinum]|uniref:Lipoprotein n=1 Tax=Microbaculum marinum TaxID=1764581 RepID=A0AAW9RR30_9HYPH
MRLTRIGGIAGLATMLALACTATQAQECCDQESPFRPGEGWAETPATCETIGHWAQNAPQTNVRISLAIDGKLSEVHWDGALAYLIMCEPEQVQVMCVTYDTNGLEPGETVSFGGGYSQIGPTHIVLDPCLASRSPG